jgi:hypothetical protein
MQQYRPTKKTSSAKYIFGSMKAAQVQYEKGNIRLKRSQPTRPLSADELLRQMRAANEREAK